MSKKSFIKQIVVFMVVLIILLMFVLAIYSVSSYSILRREIRQGSENFMHLYGGELKSRITQMDTILKNLLVQNSSQLEILKSEEEAKRYYASQDIINYMRDIVLSDDSADCLVVADDNFGTLLDAKGATMTYWDKEAMRSFTLERTTRNDLATKWDFVELNSKNYLYKMYIYNGRAIAAFTSTEHFMETIPMDNYANQTYVLTDGERVIEDFSGVGIEDNSRGIKLNDTGAVNSFTVEYIIEDEQILLFSLVKDYSIWKQTRMSTASVLGVILLTIAFGFLLVRYIQKEMVNPMRSMAEGMKRVDEGEYTLHFKGEYDTIEFTHLKDSFNKLMDEIVDLKIKEYEKIIEVKDSQLKIIRLQIRPHFFLNAITTIHSLSSQGKSKQIDEYIEALSKNIRYMFKSSLRTVPVREEIRYVENYFKMQELKYAGYTFHYVELPKELEEWRIPQMIIQTFIENEFKYAVSMDYVLTILIRISKCSHQGEKMLAIEIEDDGKGYPEDVLFYMNGSTSRSTNNGNRIGLWSIKCMLELMYERTDLIKLWNIEPHGCKNRILVPAVPVHEINEDSLELIGK